jgi:hypothetical protein
MLIARTGSLAAVAVAAALLLLGAAASAHAQPAVTTAADRKAAEALVVRWLVAQNEGNFAAYEALYAQSFTGTKRAGTQVKTFDRAAWLKDRKAMFKHRMAVTGTPLEIKRDGAALVITVLQRFEQGNFADIGEKRLVVDLRPSAGPILAEEMLKSRVFPSRDACARAVFPQGRGGRTGPDAASSSYQDREVYDLGTETFLCRLEHQGRGQRGRTLELAVLKRGKPWAVVEQVTHEVQAEAELGAELDEQQVRESYDLALEPITDTEHAVLLERKKSITGPMQNDSETVSELFRVTPKGLVSLIRYETKWDEGEALRGTRCTLHQGDAQHGGFHDLRLDCVTTIGSYHDEDPADRGEKHTEESKLYRWNGKKYVAR